MSFPCLKLIRDGKTIVKSAIFLSKIKAIANKGILKTKLKVKPNQIEIVEITNRTAIQPSAKPPIAHRLCWLT